MHLTGADDINDWTKQAEHDFAMAQKIIDEGGYDTCAFLCQQAVEKYLKALFIMAPCDEYSKEDAKSKLQKAQTVLCWVKGQLNP
jgi:HEPN domain-containing protein